MADSLSQNLEEVKGSLALDPAALPSDWRLVRVGRNKAPIGGKNWFQVDDYSPDDAAALNGSSPPAWGLKCGPASGGVLLLDGDAEGWNEDFQLRTGHPITDLPKTIGWTSGRPGRSAQAFQVDPDWWPHLANVRAFTRPWREGDELGKNGSKGPVTLWELRWNGVQSVIIGAHPLTGSYRWLPGQSPRDISDPAPAPDWLLEALVVQELPNVAPVAPTAADAVRAVAMLRCLPPEQYADYWSWLRAGMALHHTDAELLTAWVDWCRPMAGFDEAECLEKWDSFGKGHKGKPATISTLHYLAKQHGYKEPKRQRPKSKVVPGRQVSDAGDGAQPEQHQQPALEAPFRILGWGTKLDAIWVQTGQTGVVASIPPSKNGLQRIAALPYWEALYPSKLGTNWDSAISSICEQAHDLRQTFTPDRIRGRGVWLDNNRVVWHLGNRLEVDGQPVALTQLQGTSWTYASLPTLDIRPDEQQLTDEEGAAVLDLIHNQMQWTNSGDGLLIAGSIVLGNICGALDLRPGLQLTGPSQAGKSTVERRIIRPLQGGLGVRPSGATEAGIRQRMQADALPVVIDESEGEAAKQREGHLRLLRLSFDGQEQIRGTAGGQALTYTMRSSITLIGINAAVPNLADRNRLVVVCPRKMPPEQWADFMLKRDALITVKTGQCLIRRSVTNLKALLANISTFQAVIASTGLADRAAEVYGSLLAGAHHLTSAAVLEPQQALTWFDSVGWSGLDEETKEAIASDAEGRACLDHLLGHPVHWKESKTGSVDVRELLTIVRTSANSDDAKKALGRLGMKFDIALGLVVSNGTRLFTSTRWANGAHRDRLLEIEGANRVSGAVWFAGGGAHKAVSVPVKHLALTELDA